MANLNFKAQLSRPVLAVARACALLFGKSGSKAAPSIEHVWQIASALSGCQIFEVDVRSKVIAAKAALFEPHTQLVEHFHLADRPQFLLALSNANEKDQTLTARVRQGDGLTFSKTQVNIHNHAGSLFVSIHQNVHHHDEQYAHKAPCDLAHELRTPLSAIVGLADALSQPQTCSDEMRATYPALIAAAGRNLIEMTAEILDPSAEQVSSDLSLVAQDCIALLRPMAAQKSITLYNRLAASMINKTVNGAALRQIITNLISNAIKFSPAGASVELSAQKSANGWLLSVTDNGGGIAPEDIARLGQRNFRSQSAAGIAGYGLGLSIVCRLVDEAGGRINFESRLGNGTRVTITFPASTLIELADFQSRPNDVPVSTPFFKNAAGAKHAAA